MCFSIHLELNLTVCALRFSPDVASKRGLTPAEMAAVEAIHRAVEFNPHVPKVRKRDLRDFIVLLFNIEVFQIKFS